LDIITYDGLRMRVGPTPDDDMRRIIAAGGRRAEIYAGLKRIADTYGDAIRTGLPDIPRRVSGYNLDELLPEKGFNVARALVGTEGMCVTVLEATLQLIPKHAAHSLLVLGYKDHFAAADAVPAVLAAGPLTGLEGFDRHFVEEQQGEGLNRGALSLLPRGGGWLLAEFGAATQDEAHARAEEAFASLTNGAPSARSSRVRPTSCRPSAVRSPASTATGRRSPSCCRGCTATSSFRRFASSSRSGIRTGR